MNPLLPILCSLPLLAGGGEGEASPALALQGGGQATILPVQDLVQPFVRNPWPLVGLQLVSRTDDPGPWLRPSWISFSLDVPLRNNTFWSGPKEPFWGENLVTDLSRLFGEFRNGKASLRRIQGVGLLYVGPAELRKKVEAELEALRLGLVPRLRVRALLIRAPSGANWSRLDAKGVKLVFDGKEGDAGVLWSGEARGRPGDVLSLGTRSYARFLRDVNVEIAQDSKIADPEVATLRLGQDLVVCPILDAGGDRVAVFASFDRRSLAGEIEARDLPPEGLENFEIARVDTTSRVFSVMIKPGTGVLLPVHSRTEGELGLFLAVERLDPDPVVRKGEAIVPTGLLSSLHRDPSLLPESGDSGLPGPLLLEAGQVVDAVRSMVGDAMEQEEMHILEARSGFVIRGPEETVAGVAEAARFFLRPFQESFLVEFRLEWRKLGGQDRTWRPLQRGLLLPVLNQRVGFLQQGIEQTYLAEFGSEIAQEAAILDPFIDAFFHGMQIGAFVQSEGERVRLTLGVGRQALRGMRRLAKGSEMASSTVSPQLESREFTKRLSLRPGEVVDLGDALVRELPGVGPVRSRLVVVVRKGL